MAWNDEAIAWVDSGSFAGLAADVLGACDEEDGGEDQCVEEWDEIHQKIIDEGITGNDVSAASGVRAYAAGALLAAVVGGAALL
ncbi:hypothetical protein IMZ48_27850 [Candidatus Bathyarchaeota archaeon]|nr:hypothetical protein [Candidatus Bathyarchaeota archaeon]